MSRQEEYPPLSVGDLVWWRSKGRCLYVRVASTRPLQVDYYGQPIRVARRELLAWRPRPEGT